MSPPNSFLKFDVLEIPVHISDAHITVLLFAILVLE